jgi:transcription elongation factor GreA-like protein
MSYTMKLWERIIEHCLRGVTNVTKNQLSFMPERSTMEVIFLIRKLMESSWNKRKTCIKDMYDKFLTIVQTSDGDTFDFTVNIGLHQGSALSHYPFAFVMDEVTREICGGIPWCMLFADDVVLVDKSRTGVDQKLKL